MIATGFSESLLESPRRTLVPIRAEDYCEPSSIWPSFNIGSCFITTT